MAGDTSGALQLKALGLRLKALGGAAGAGGAATDVAGLAIGPKTLRAQLIAAIKVAAKPAMRAASDAARSNLPRAGGLNAVVADSKIKTTVKTAGPRVGVRIVDSGPGTRNANRGYIRHPVFGVWRPNVPNQPVPSGWFDRTLANQAPGVTADIRAVLELVAQEATRRL